MGAGTPLVLVVDDDPSIREVMEDVLVNEGFTVATVSDGQQALDWLRSHKEAAVLILLDLMMPVLDGLGFLRQRAIQNALSQVPVLVLTAGDCEQVHREHGEQILGCLRKPVALERLLEVVHSCPS